MGSGWYNEMMISIPSDPYLYYLITTWNPSKLQRYILFSY